MIAIDRNFDRLLAALALLIAVAMGPSARAQRAFDRDLLDRPVQLTTNTITDSQLEQWAFGSMGADEFRRRLELRLTARVNDINRICALSEAQKKKLHLAGRIDIRRFFDEVERIKQTIRDTQGDGMNDRDPWPVSRPFETIDRKNFFGADSLLGKSLKHTLGSEQLARYERIEREQIAARHQATLKWVLGILDTTLQLNAEQHGRLATLLAEDTRPPRKFGEYDYYGVMFQVSRLPDTRVKPIFDAGQWAKLQVQLKEAARLEATLVQGGFIPEQGVAGAGPARERKGAIVQPKDQDG
jgi:hypothetical protein